MIQKILGYFTRYFSLILLVAIWQGVCSAGLISPHVLASPVAVVRTAETLVRDGSLPKNLMVSLVRAASGLSLAVIMGVVLALISGLSRMGEEVVDGPMQIFRTLPALALVPLFILWFGIGETPKILLVAFGAAFPIYLNLHKGIRGVDVRLLEMGKALGLSHSQVVRDIILPSALPDFIVGLRFAVGISWLMLVVAEQVNAESGIGHMMMDAEDFLRTDVILVGLAVYGFLGLMSDQIVRYVERFFLIWSLDKNREVS